LERHVLRRSHSLAQQIIRRTHCIYICEVNLEHLRPIHSTLIRVIPLVGRLIGSFLVHGLVGLLVLSKCLFVLRGVHADEVSIHWNLRCASWISLGVDLTQIPGNTGWDIALSVQLRRS